MGEISKDIYINSSISSNRIAVTENEQLVEFDKRLCLLKQQQDKENSSQDMW